MDLFVDPLASLRLGIGCGSPLLAMSLVRVTLWGWRDCLFNSGDTNPISRACRHLNSGRTVRGSNAVLLDTFAPSNGLIFRLSTLGIDDSGRLGVIVSR
jgi:hypothetical protein